ncbi:MAG TPA: hypothetical protein VLX85_07675 [Stellaceae bacterium]|nr:hypothetical protein [Stellaceae bacterium]
MDDEDDDDRATRSLAALAVVLFLALVALYIIVRLRERGEIEDCLMRGRTNCAPVIISGSR